MIDVRLVDLRPGDLMYGFMHGHDDTGCEILCKHLRLVLAVIHEHGELHVWWFIYDGQECQKYVYCLKDLTHFVVRISRP